MSFSVGMKVTKKTDAPWFVVALADMGHEDVTPEYGKVYAISDIFEWGGHCFLVLDGFTDGYHALCFERVVEPKVELPESLTALLDPANHKTFEPVVVKPESVA